MVCLDDSSPRPLADLLSQSGTGPGTSNRIADVGGSSGAGGSMRQPPTSAEIDAVIAAAMANAPPAPPPMELAIESESPLRARAVRLLMLQRRPDPSLLS